MLISHSKKTAFPKVSIEGKLLSVLLSHQEYLTVTISPVVEILVNIYLYFVYRWG